MAFKDIVINIDKDRKITALLPEGPEDFLVIQDEKYRPDKEKFIFEAFRIDFPHLTDVDSAQMVYRLASRQKNLALWLAQQNLQYAKLQDEPTYYRDSLTADEYSLVSKDIQALTKLNKDRANEELIAIKEYKDKMDKIAKKYTKFKYSNDYSRIVTMNSTELPLSLQLAIENFVPTTEEGDPTQKAYAREVLVRYKLSLIKYVQNNPGVDVEKLISDAYTK